MSFLNWFRTPSVRVNESGDLERFEYVEPSFDDVYPTPAIGQSRSLFGDLSKAPSYRCTNEVGISFKRLSSTAIAPKYATDQAVGMDLCADQDASIPPGETRLIITNIALNLPSNVEAQVRPRSGLALKKHITVLNSPGTIDPDYRGGIGVILYNAGKELFQVKPGDRIAQLVFQPRWKAYLYEVDDLSETGRGTGAYGSTGV
jgi:dUTP pyrophosphatase